MSSDKPVREADADNRVGGNRADGDGVGDGGAMSVPTTGSEGNTDLVGDDPGPGGSGEASAGRGSLIDHPTDGTDSEDRPASAAR